MSAATMRLTRRVRYVAVIADGNGRWASARGLSPTAGHEAGAETLRGRLADAAEFGVRELTVYSFSTENWARPIEEVHGLIAMLDRRIAQETPELHRQGVRMRFIGSRDQLPNGLRERMAWAERLTRQNRRITLFVAFNYGGRAEILEAAQKFQGGSERDFRALLCSADVHDPEVVIRTGAEQRLSNFLLWHAADSELVFREELWPDFSREALAECLAEVQHRRSPDWRAPRESVRRCIVSSN